MITEQQLKAFAPACNGKLIPDVTKWFNNYADEYQVNSPLRIAAFFSQVIHESDNLNTTKEYASGKEYEGRVVSLGNTEPGDGVKFKGRGLIQVTGRRNYTTVSHSLFKDEKVLLDHPEILEQPQFAVLSAFWFWKDRDLNKLADIQYLETITKRVNGGLNGWDNRLKIYNHICDLLVLPHWKK